MKMKHVPEASDIPSFADAVGGMGREGVEHQLDVVAQVRVMFTHDVKPYAVCLFRREPLTHPISSILFVSFRLYFTYPRRPGTDFVDNRTLYNTERAQAVSC